MATKQTQNSGADKQPACIWMQAGVVSHKICRLNYQCTACGYHRALQRTVDENRRLIAKGIPPRGKRARIVSWKDRLREQPLSRRPCLHAMKKRIEFRSCTNDYNCSDCEFDQFFYDQFTVHAVVKPVAELDIDGFHIPQGYYLHRGHAWVKIEEANTVRIGLDDFAMRTFGPFDQIHTPLMGKTLRQNQPQMRLRRGEHEACLLSPISGVITDTNPRLLEEENIRLRGAYTDDWFVRVHADNLRRDLAELMISDETAGFMKEEVDRLYQVIEETAGPLAADGGQLGSDIFGNMPEIGWEKLTKTFLRT